MKEIFGSALLWPAEQLLNSVIRSDQHVQNQLARFAGRAIEIQILHSPLSLTATMETDGVRLSTVDAARYAIPVDATVKGSASTLTQLLLSEHADQPLVNSNLQITGDAQLVQDLFTALKRLDLQWEDLLSPLLGEISTQQLSQAIDDAEDWARDSQRRMKNNVDDYLKEELKLFPASAQLTRFQNSLDALKLRLDRIEARAHRLKGNLEKQATPRP